MQSREEGRTHRENEILKELALMNKLSMSNFALVDRNFRKMLRKILILTIDRPVQRKKQVNHLETSLPLHEVLS